MDSAHRHELKTNEMEKLARQAIPFFEQYGNHIAIGICVVSIALSAWIYFGRTSYNNRASAWTNLDTATAAADSRVCHFRLGHLAFVEPLVRAWRRLDRSPSAT